MQGVVLWTACVSGPTVISELNITALQLLWAAKQEAGALGLNVLCQGKVPEMIPAAVRDMGLESFPLLVTPLEG